MASSKLIISQLWPGVHSRKFSLDSSLNELFDSALKVQIGCMELPLAQLFVLSLYRENFGRRGFKSVLPTIV